MSRTEKSNTTSHQERLMKEALDIISGSRREAYGPPERNFPRIAALWDAYLAVSFDSDVPRRLNAIDVCHMLDLLKLARLVETPNHEDSIRDRLGYQGCYIDLVYGGEVGIEARGPPDDGVPEDWMDWPADVDPPPVTDLRGAK